MVGSRVHSAHSIARSLRLSLAVALVLTMLALILFGAALQDLGHVSAVKDYLAGNLCGPNHGQGSSYSAGNTAELTDAATDVYDTDADSDDSTAAFSIQSVKGATAAANINTCAADDAIRSIDETWGSYAMDMSVAHAGSTARIRRVVCKLMAGETVTVGVLGGSITFGRGLRPSEDPTVGPWPDLLRHALRKHFPAAKIDLINGAVPATGTDYFAYCYGQHVGDSADLVIVEAAVNDIIIENSNADATKGGKVEGAEATRRKDAIMVASENLVRDILSRRDDNAVMMMSLWVYNQDYSNGADKHAVVSEFYDVPRISTRPFFYQYLMQNMDELGDHYGAPDFGHQVQLAHQYISDTLLRFILQQACYLEKHNGVPVPENAFTGSSLKHSFDPYRVPKLRLAQRLNGQPIPEGRAFCFSSNVRRPDGSPTLFPSGVQGFKNVTMHDKYYWMAEEAGATITFSDLEVHGGTLLLFHLRSSNQGLGNMRCWADNDKGKATIVKGYWYYVSVGSSTVVATGLTEGKHSMTCEVTQETDDPEGKHKAQIIAVLGT